MDDHRPDSTARTHRRALLLFRLPLGVVRFALVARLVDEWWSYLPAGAIDDFRLDLDLSYAAAGWLLAGLWFGGLLAHPLAVLADHLPRRPLAAAGAAGLTAGLAAYALGAPFAVLFPASGGRGAARDLVLRPLEAALAELEPERLDRLLGRQHVLSWFGDLAGPAILAIGASTALGWQGAFGVTAGVTGLWAVVLALTEFPPPPSATETLREGYGEAFRLFRRRDVLTLAAAEIVLTTLDEPFFGFAVARLAADGAGATAQILAIGAFAGGLAGSALVERIGLRPLARRAGTPLLALGAVVVALAPWIAIQIVGMAILAGGMALVWAALHHRMLTIVPGRSGSVAAAIGLLGTFGALGPVAVGAVSDATSLTVGLLACAAASLLLIPLAATRPAPAVGTDAATSHDPEDEPEDEPDGEPQEEPDPHR
jgi:predicted MFS family arabinose efflux permease